MNSPHLTFACELETDELLALLDRPGLLETLAGLKARISLGLIDLSAGRARAVQRLQAAGIPLVAWLLLPKEEGYWFNAHNAPQAVARYTAFQEWTRDYGLHWAAVGLDIEPNFQEMRQMTAGHAGRLLPTLAGRLWDGRRLLQAQQAYAALVARMRADGYTVESYQFPFIVDERRGRSTLLQRLFGIVDVSTDHEVLMLYSSFMRTWGAGLLWSYAPQAQGIGIGSTGGGVELEGDFPALTWEELERDLCLAWQWSDEIFIFSLEGCLRQGYLERLVAFDWSPAVRPPLEAARSVEQVRRLGQGILWLGSRPLVLVGLIAGAVLLARTGRRPRREHPS